MNSAILFLERSAQRYPQKIAIEFNDEQIRYSELRAKAISVGYSLSQHTKRQPILVFLPKSIESILSFLGTLYSGNFYVPVDFSMPMARLRKIIENLQPAGIITNEEGKSLLDVGSELRIFLIEDLLTAEVQPHVAEKEALTIVAKTLDTDPIYIMYTSGSTGTPKGVTIPHKGVIDYANWVVQTFEITEDSILGNQAAFFFDNSVLDIYGCLASGATLVIIPEALFLYPDRLLPYINEKKIDTIFWVPTVLIAVANSGILENCKLNDLKKVLFCGEVMPNTQLNIWRKNYPSLFYANLYGPTEITDVCTYFVVKGDFANTDSLPIGIPCENMDILLLKEDGSPAKTGETGEICVLGTGLALGYWNAPQLTEKAFIQNPNNKSYLERIYKTGDLGYWREDGLLMYIGRMDTQIKLKGKRIELGEIETAAKSLPNINNACVLFQQEEGIVLFVESAAALKLRQINLLLKELIPSYMLPSKLHVMERLPLTPNGKIDRVRLKGILNEERCL